MPQSATTVRPPLTITGVAPWAMSQGSDVTKRFSSFHSSAEDSTNSIDGMAQILAYIENCTPKSSTLPVNWQEQQV